jgi:hypothetical protein
MERDMAQQSQNWRSADQTEELSQMHRPSTSWVAGMWAGPTAAASAQSWWKKQNMDAEGVGYRQPLMPV